MSTVAVVLINWNGLSDTIKCLRSLEKQTRLPDVIYCIDNASNNNEALTLRNMFPSVVILEQERNTGFCGGSNVGIREALSKNYKYILLLNNDTIAPTNLVELLLNSYALLPNAGAISPLIVREDDLIWFAGAQWEPKTAGFKHLNSGNHLSTMRFKEPFETHYACGCCLFTSTAVVRDVGMLDERYFAYYDEADWCSRMSIKGYKSYVIPSVKLIHKVSGSTPSAVSTYLMARNRFLWMREHLPLREQVKSIPYLIREIIWIMTHPKDRLSEILYQSWVDYLSNNLGPFPEHLFK